MMPEFQNVPRVARADAPLWGQLTGLQPQQEVVLEVRFQDELKRTWKGQTRYQASAQGSIDLAAAHPVGAAWTGSDAYGPYWSMTLQDKTDFPWSFEAVTAELQPLQTQLTALSSSDVIAEANFERQFVFNATQEIWRDDLTANLFLPVGAEVSAGVLVLGGSEGGFTWANQVAALVAASGRAALALAYFDWQGRYGLPTSLTEIPVEYFERALERLQNHPRVIANTAIVSFSKGTEAAFLLASQRNDISDVVAYAPSTYVWEAAQLEPGDEARSSWTWHGESVPFATFDADEAFYESFDKTALRELHDKALAKDLEFARIKVEDSSANFLLISGSDDRVWSADAMSKSIVKTFERAEKSSQVKHLHFDGAGHSLIMPGLPSGERLGGSALVNACADKTAWAALRARLGLS